MSGLLDKAKEKLGKSGGSGHEGGGGEQSGVEKAASKQMNTRRLSPTEADLVAVADNDGRN